MGFGLISQTTATAVSNPITRFSSNPISIIAIAILLIIIYFLPGMIGNARGVKRSAQVWVINIFLGLTYIGWVIALVMAFSPEKEEEKKIQ